MPPWRLEMLAKYEVEERSADKLPKTLDYRILDMPDIGGQYSVLVGCCHEATAKWILESGRQARLGEVEIDLEALGLYNAYYHGHGYDPELTVLIVDIGAEEVTVLLVKNGALYLARTFLGGGRRFSQVLADELKIDPLEADEVKKTSGEICFDLPAPASPARILRTGRTTVLGGSLRRGQPQTLELPSAGNEPGAPSIRKEAAPPGPESGEAAEAQEIVKRVHEEARESHAQPGVLKDDLELESLPAEAIEAEPARSAPASAGAETSAERRRRQISTALVREAAALCATLENTIANCKQQIKQRELKMDKVYLCGGGSRLKGLAEFVSRRMRVPAEPLEVFKRVGLDRFPAEMAEALKQEQVVLAVAAGLALAPLRTGAFSFLLWPAELKARKEFRSRGAFLYYAAAVLLAALALFWLMPKRNAESFRSNATLAKEAVAQARASNANLDKLADEHTELARRLKQIEDNSNSGDFFLKVLTEINKRIPTDVYLTAVSTGSPSVIRDEVSGKAEGGLGIAEPAARSGLKSRPKGPKGEEAPETFQSQARVFLRGFARHGQSGIDLLNKIQGERSESGAVLTPGFTDILVPHRDDPNHLLNLFKDVRLIWTDKEQLQGNGIYLREFVLESFVEGTRETKKGEPPAKALPKPGKPESQKPAPGNPEARKPDGKPVMAEQQF